MADGTMKRVDHLKQGDLVLCPSSTRVPSSEPIIAQVQSILRTFSSTGSMKLISFPNGLLITPWHPIKLEKSEKWTFPALLHATASVSSPDSSSLLDFISIETKAVYSFLLGPESVLMSSSSSSPGPSSTLKRLNPLDNDRGQSMRINGVICLTLAHGILHDEVASHSFYGTEKIVMAMKKRGTRFMSKEKQERDIRAEDVELMEEEYVDLFEGDILKDPLTNLAIGFNPKM
jgi:hypothetical protein